MLRLILVMLLLVGCVTTSNSPKFKLGDCAKFNKERLKEGQYTEGITFFIKDVGQKFYFVQYFHPKLGDIKILILHKVFDRDWIHTECSLTDQIDVDELHGWGMTN